MPVSPFSSAFRIVPGFCNIHLSSMEETAAPPKAGFASSACGVTGAVRPAGAGGQPRSAHWSRATVPQTSARELPDDCENITDQSQRRPGGNNYALHVVISP